MEPAAGRRGVHVVYSVLSLDTGGLERLVLELAFELRRRGDRVSVVCVERRGQLAEQVEKLGAEVFCLDKPPGRSKAAVDRAEQLLRRLSPDVVHTHQIGALWYLGQAAKRRGRIAVVHTEHTDHARHVKGLWGKIRNRIILKTYGRLAGKFCCVSEDVSRSVRRWGTLPARKVTVVTNGIDTEKYVGRENRARIRADHRFGADDFVFGTVGRLAEVKRQDLLLRGMAKARADVPNAKLLIVGDGAERAALTRLARELGIGDAVVFAGYQAEPQAFLQAMDAFVLTSRHEALPLALLEAMAAGLPVISSAVGGIPDLVTNRKSGFLFESLNEGALVEALRRVTRERELSAAIAAEGRRLVRERYSLGRMVDEYQAIYRELIGS